MRIRRLRGSSVPGLGNLDVQIGDGLVGWVGGVPRDRRILSELILHSAGLSDRSPEDEPPGPGRPSSTDGSMLVEVGGRQIVVRDGAVVRRSGSRPAESLSGLVGLAPDDLALGWAGGPGADIALLFEAGAQLLARLRGADRLEAAIDRLGRGSVARAPDGESSPAPDGEREALHAELRSVEGRLEALEAVPERLGELENELRTLRGDAAEVSGDLEEATMDWLRERQDAETNLRNYRARARELRQRIRDAEELGPEGPCPFCGRVLEEHHESVMEELEEEWERVVQDGRWWRRRRDQLEVKPDHLRELEERSLRLQAAVDECTEELESCRFDLRERDELRRRRSELVEDLGGSAALAGEERASPGAVERPGGRRRTIARALERAADELREEEADRLVRRAGRFLNLVSGGRILGLLRRGGGAPALVEDGRLVEGPTDEDRAAAILSMRIALGVGLVEEGLDLGSILFDASFRRLDVERRLLTVELLRSLRDRIPQVLLLSGDQAVGAAPERFDQIVELRRSGGPGGGIRLRTHPGGVGSLLLDRH